MQEEKMDAFTMRKAKAKNASVPDTRIWIERLYRLLQEILWGCAGWVFGQAGLLFDTYPLGLALLCASSGHTPAVLVGLLVTTVSNMQNAAPYVCAYLTAAILRILVAAVFDAPDARFEMPKTLQKRLQERIEKEAPLTDAEWKKREKKAARSAFWKRIFGESILLRMSAAALCALIIALFRVVSGGFRYYDWFAALFLILMATAATFLFALSLERRMQNKWLVGVSEAALLFTLVYASRTVALLSFPLSPMAALFFTLFICANRSALQGILAAGVAGLAYDPIQAPAFLLAALVAIFLKQTKKESPTAVLLPVVAMLAWSGYVKGFWILLQLVPASLLSDLAFVVVQKTAIFSAPKEEIEENINEENAHQRQQVESIRYRDSSERFRGISDAFSSLSEVFYNLSDRFRRPGTLDLRLLCDRSFDAFCNDCPNKNICWGLEYTATLGAVNDLIAQLHTRGRVSDEHVDEQLANRCTRIDGILERINTDCARLTGEMLRNNRTEIVAMDYESAADIINDALEADGSEYEVDAELGKKITEYLKDADVRAESVTVFGKRMKKILIRGAEVDEAKVTFETMRSDLGEMCGSELGLPTFEVEGNVSTMTLTAKRKIAVISAQNNVSADGGVSGDSVNLFCNKKDYFYALISDGMGSGKEAALTSGLCSVFLEKMLRAGNRAATSLRMLNNMIASRAHDSTKECSSTVDLLELDLMTGEGAFLKSGAAPSFVVRGKVVRRLQAGTVPIGILNTLDVQKTEFTLRAGDTVVMVSDGIVPCDDDAEWLTSYLTGAATQAPEEIVSHICRRCTESQTRDDCSVVALRILDADEVIDSEEE
jgi:stage II sporulation protein E